MTILQIITLIILAVAAGRMTSGRQIAMLAISAFAIFWLQPSGPFASLNFWVPLATLGIVVLSWAITSTTEKISWRENWPAWIILVTVVLAEYLIGFLLVNTGNGSIVPGMLQVLLAILAITAATLVLLNWRASLQLWQVAAIAVLLLVFVVLKSPELNRWLVQEIETLHGSTLATGSNPLGWLGFSYLAFRLIHTIRDRQSGRLPPVTLTEYVVYAIFFPAFASGPIDRLERFVSDLRSPQKIESSDWLDAGSRLLLGLFKKFVIADLLSVISINTVLVSHVNSGGWLWLSLYAYAFRIYFDFSGYTDMAIGMGLLLGIRLPENFAAPYLKPNLTQFWNSWHMSLTQWFRAYVFNPITRAMRSGTCPVPTWATILLAQLVTMVLIGLWHGITWGFLIWGLWHGIGLFVHNRWSEISRRRIPLWAQGGFGQAGLAAAGVFVTFNYVALGWLFFTLPAPGSAWLAMQKLFGFA